VSGLRNISRCTVLLTIEFYLDRFQRQGRWTWGAGGSMVPQILTDKSSTSRSLDKLTLFELGGRITPISLLFPAPRFHTFRRPCNRIQILRHNNIETWILSMPVFLPTFRAILLRNRCISFYFQSMKKSSNRF
jgi:hypothetical protein